MEREYSFERFDYPASRYESLGAYLAGERVADGIHVIDDSPGPPIILLSEDRGFDTTVVMFHAAMPEGVTLPVFSGREVTDSLPVNRILLSDPSLQFSAEMNVAWFAGNRHQRLQVGLTQVIRHAFESHDRARRIVFFGPSGGGFAALYFASRFPGSVAIASNPQTDIARYDPIHIGNYMRFAWERQWEPGSPLDLPEHVITDLTPIYAEPVDAEVYYLQAARDAAHIEDHCGRFLSALHPENRVHLLVGEWGSGHTPPPAELIGRVIGLVAARDPTALVALGFRPFTPDSDIAAAVAIASSGGRSVSRLASGSSRLRDAIVRRLRAAG